MGLVRARCSAGCVLAHRLAYIGENHYTTNVLIASYISRMHIPAASVRVSHIKMQVRFGHHEATFTIKWAAHIAHIYVCIYSVCGELSNVRPPHSCILLPVLKRSLNHNGIGVVSRLSISGRAIIYYFIGSVRRRCLAVDAGGHLFLPQRL